MNTITIIAILLFMTLLHNIFMDKLSFKKFINILITFYLLGMVFLFIEIVTISRMEPERYIVYNGEIRNLRLYIRDDDETTYYRFDEGDIGVVANNIPGDIVNFELSDDDSSYVLETKDVKKLGLYEKINRNFTFYVPEDTSLPAIKK